METQPPKTEVLPYGKQSIDEDDIAAVVRVLQSDYLTTGPEVAAFEQEFAEFVGARHAVAVCNATAALHLAMLVAGIRPGDRVVTSPNTFLSSANCAAFVGATPDFSDIDSETYNLCPKALQASWQSDTKAVVAVAYAGLPCDMPAIAEVARRRGAIVIEDGCHGLGGGFVHEGRFYKIGGHPWADMTTFSFHPVKTLTTGEGGMLVTDNDEYADRARLLRSHGITREASSFKTFVHGEASLRDRERQIANSGGKDQPFAISHSLLSSGPWTYEMQALGYNYRITDIQCALGLSQLKKLPEFIRRRQEIVNCYNQAFADKSWITIPKVTGWRNAEIGSQITENRPPETGHRKPTVSWHLYTVQIDFESIGKARTEVIAALREQGIGTQVLYIPVYLQPWYQNTYGYSPGKCPDAEEFYRKALSLPLFPSMTDGDVARVIEAVGGIVYAR